MPPEQVLLRSGARPGHDIWVSGRLGDARLALEVFRGHVTLPGSAFEEVRRAMELPEPRVPLGLALRGVATSAIDLSDGLIGDLGHVMRLSGVGAMVDVDALPRSAVLGAQPLALQHAVPAGRRRRLRTAVHRAAVAPRRRAAKRRARRAWPSRAAASSRPATTLRIVDAHGRAGAGRRCAASTTSEG